MAKIVHIRGCGPMVCSSYREVTAAIDRAYAVPNRPMQWRGILASLADGWCAASTRYKKWRSKS